MKAGRELDALVAEQVMGWERWIGNVDVALLPPQSNGQDIGWSGRTDKPPTEPFCGPHYSTDIAAAWQVWERLTPLMKAANSGLYNPDTLRLEQDYDGYTVGWVEGFCGEDEHQHFLRLAEADTAPLAICLAALNAAGVEVPS